MLAFVIAVLCIQLTTPAFPQDIKSVPYNSITVEKHNLIDFEGLRGENDYLKVSTVLDVGLATFGERFSGQIISEHSNLDGFNFDFVTGKPTAPIKLRSGAPTRNLAIEYKSDWASDILFGVGMAGVDEGAGAGEGTVAILLKKSACGFGFQTLLEAPNISDQDLEEFGKLNVTFYDNDGKVLGNFKFSSKNDEENVSFGFMQTSAILPKIRGVLLQNFDRGGVPFDNLKFEFDCETLSS